VLKRTFILVTAALLILTGCASKEVTLPDHPTPGPASILAPGAKVEKVAGGFRFTEGPVWVPDGYLLFSDIPANTIYRWSPGSAEATAWRTPSGHSNGLTLDRDGRLIACEHDRRVSRTEPDGRVVTLADRYQGKRLNSPNDVVIRSDGRIFFTDPPYGLPNQREGKELDYNGVFRLDPNGTLTLLDDSFVRPNGLAFSPDERTLYVDDSSEMHIRAFDVAADGSLSNGRLFAVLREPGVEGVPDGMKVDVAGNVFCTGPGGVWVLAPSGDLVLKIETPEVPANLAWGYRIRTQTGGASLVDR